MAKMNIREWNRSGDGFGYMMDEKNTEWYKSYYDYYGDKGIYIGTTFEYQDREYDIEITMETLLELLTLALNPNVPIKGVEPQLVK